MVMNDIKFDFLSSIKDKVSQIHLFWNSDNEIDLWKYVDKNKWTDVQKSKYNNLSDKEFIENRYKLLKEKKIEELYKITSFAKWNKPFDVFKKWYENLYDLKIVWISKREDGSYQIVVDVWYKWKYKDAKLWTWHKNYYDLQCIPGDTDTWYYKRIVVYKRIVNMNWVKKLQTVKVNLEQTLALPYNFKGKLTCIWWECNWNSSKLDHTENYNIEIKNDVDSIYKRINHQNLCQIKSNKMNKCRNEKGEFNDECIKKYYDSSCDNTVVIQWAWFGENTRAGPLGSSYFWAVRKWKDFVLAFIKYTEDHISNRDGNMKFAKEQIEQEKRINLTSDLVYFDFKRNKKYLFEFNIAKYACDLWYKKLYFSLQNKNSDVDDEFPSYKRKNYVIWNSIAKAVNNGPEDYLKNAFKTYFK